MNCEHRTTLSRTSLGFGFCSCVVGLVLTALFLVGCGREESPMEPKPIVSVNPVGWLNANAFRIRTINPDDEDFGDLAFLAEVLDGRSMVLLGEQSHGDGATFYAKSRLVKYLHQELGFDVLALEGGLYDCRKSWTQLINGMPADQAFSNGVPWIWSLSKQVQSLIDYWGSTSNGVRPLELAGIDCQFSGQNSEQFLISDLERHLAATGSEIMSDEAWPDSRFYLSNLVLMRYRSIPPPSEDAQQAFFAMMERLEDELTEVVGDSDPEETAFWRQLVRSTNTEARSAWSIDWSSYIDNPDSLLNLRDRQMAENLIWLAQHRYPGRKIIVWAATFHNAKVLELVDVPTMPGLYDGRVPMGQIVAEALGDEFYSIGFTASEGRVGVLFMDSWVLEPPAKNSLEDLLSQTWFDRLFVDYRSLDDDGAWLSEPLESWPLGYLEMIADWTQVMDGLVYTRVMTPSTRAAGRVGDSTLLTGGR